MSESAPSPDTRVVIALRNAIADPLADAKVLIFFPWYDDDPTELSKVARALKLPLFIAKAGIADPAGAAGLLQMIEAIQMLSPGRREDETLRETISALEDWPATEALFRCARERIATTMGLWKIHQVLLFCPRHIPDGEQWQARAIAFARELKIPRIVVSGASRPSQETRDVPIPWMEFSDDVKMVAPPAPEPDELASPTAISQFIAYLRRLSSWRKQRIEIEDPPPASERTPSVGERWHSLVLRLCFPNAHLANKVISQWRIFEKATTELKDGRPEVEQEILRDRGRFLTLLRELWPQAYRAARSDLDGADQLYRLHLALFGGAGHDSLLSGLLLPRWRASLEEPLFREFLFDCFGASSGYRPLVQRFESRTQLSKHLRWHEKIANQTAGFTAVKGSEEREDQTRPETIRENFGAWVKSIHEDLTEKRTIKSLPKFRSSVLEPIRAIDNLDSGEALEFAQMLMTALELFANIQSFEAESEELGESVFHLLEQALARSQGALRFEALLLRARMLAAKGYFLEASEMIRPLRRMGQDPLSRAAMDIEEAFIRERAGDYLGAQHRYQEVLAKAEQIAADELSARAILGQLRCDIVASSTKSANSSTPGVLPLKILTLRAQAMVQIQTARAPELFLLSPSAVPRLFVSYRSGSCALTRQIAARVPELSSTKMSCWYDGDLKHWEDFSPVIHRELLSCDAMLLLLSPEFFDSEWCLHELHFALGQHDLRGLPLFWCCCEPAGARPVVSCTVALNEWKNSLFPTLKNSAHRTAHFAERVARLTRTGVCVSQDVVQFEGSVTSPASGTGPMALELDTLDKLLMPIAHAMPYLRERRALKAS
jgi:hypothetical protein